MKTPSPSSSAFNASHDDHGIPPWEEASARFQDEDDAFDLADTVNEAPESEPDSSLYSTLAIDPTASEEQVKAAYKRAALAFHPDKTGSTGNTEAAEREFARVQRAYDGNTIRLFEIIEC